MSVRLDDLIPRALAARANAYAPYSAYPVGAAVATRDGRVFTGANVENASYGLSLCAERVAVASAVAAGMRPGELAGIAIATSSSPPAGPCGMCRQTLAELAGDDLPLVLVNDRGERSETRLGDLLPHAFRRGDLAR